MWFSEGVTSTVGDLLLARSGLIDEANYLRRISDEITELQRRPAHQWQSAEESSLDAWFEGNAFYRSPERSISYYNKGEILGVLLDLRMRQLTSGSKSLRDLFQWMNEHYAKQHRYFPDSAGVEEAAETVTGQSFAEFLPRLRRRHQRDSLRRLLSVCRIAFGDNYQAVRDAGFATTANLGAQPEVTSVEPDSEAQRRGLPSAIASQR